MKKPIIAITGNHFFDHTDKVSSYLTYCATGFVSAVQEAGGLPLVMPIGNEDLVKDYARLADKFIFTGGQNVSPHFFDEEKKITSDDYLLQRDQFELSLIKEVLLLEKPIFTVCRGTQLFNVAMGGSLHQSIENHWLEEVSPLQHEIRVVSDSILSQHYPDKSSVNSFHRQSIKELAPSLKVVAVSDGDGIIEAIERTDHYPYLGVQWHPELLFHERREEKSLFDYIVNKL